MQICGKNYREELGKLVAPDQLLPSLGGTCTAGLSGSFGPWAMQQQLSMPDPHFELDPSDAVRMRAVSQLATATREKRSSLEDVAALAGGYRASVRRRRCVDQRRRVLPQCDYCCFVLEFSEAYEQNLSVSGR